MGAAWSAASGRAPAPRGGSRGCRTRASRASSASARRRPRPDAGGAELAAVGLAGSSSSRCGAGSWVRGVDAHLEGLQPVAVPQALEGEAVAGRRGEGVERRQRGRRQACLGAQPGPHHAGHHAAPGSCAGARAVHSVEPTGSAGVSRQRPSAANFQPWKGQRMPSPSWRAKARSAPRCGQSRSSRPKRPATLATRRGTARGPAPAGARPSAGARPCAGRCAGRTRPAARPAASSGASARRRACRGRHG
jgi:hypothetical protein